MEKEREQKEKQRRQEERKLTAYVLEKDGVVHLLSVDFCCPPMADAWSIDPKTGLHAPGKNAFMKVWKFASYPIHFCPFCSARIVFKPVSESQIQMPSAEDMKAVREPILEK